MTTASPLYGATVAHTITLTGLASDTNLVAGRQSTAIDNKDTDDALDAMLGGVITTGTTPTASRQIEVWTYGSWDDATYSGNAGASDANLTPSEKVLLALIAVIPTVSTSDKGYQFGPRSVAQAFGGFLPVQWGSYVVHNTAVALNATAANQAVKHTPCKVESA